MDETLIKRIVYNYLKAANEEEEQLYKEKLEKILEYRGKRGIYLEVLRMIKRTMQEEIKEKVNAYLSYPYYTKTAEEYEAEEITRVVHYYGFIYYNVIE